MRVKPTPAPSPLASGKALIALVRHLWGKQGHAAFPPWRQAYAGGFGAPHR